MVTCQICGKAEVSVGCVLCRRNLCDRCFDEHIDKISADMDEGFAAVDQGMDEDDQPVVCDHCGLRLESAKMDEHLFEVHGISG